MARGSFLLLAALAACGVGWSGVARAEDAEPREAPGVAEPSEPPPEEPSAPSAESPNAAAPSPEGVPAESAPAEGAPADAHPPELLHAIEPEYPPEAAAARLEATVVLRVDIDAEGTVTEAAVIEPAGHGFDEAARAAVLRARYLPARRGDTNVPSRILVRVDFRLPEVTPTGTLEGRILLPGSGATG